MRTLLGFAARDNDCKGHNIRSRALATEAVQGILSEPFPEDVRVRDRLLHRLFLIILRGCLLGNNSSTIYFSIVGALRDVDRTVDYDCRMNIPKNRF